MPFKLPTHLLECFKRSSPEAKIDQLVRTIGQVNELIQGREDALSALVRKHIFMAEEDCNEALVNSKFDNKYNIAESLRRVKFGLFRLELAKQQLISEQLESCPPNFAENTVEYRALELSGAIIKIKLAIEFSNCVVSEALKLELVKVVKLFNETIELLKLDKRDKSRRTAEAGLLLLFLMKKEIEIDNNESIVDISSVWKNASKESQKIKKTIEATFHLKTACCNCPNQASPKVLSRLNYSIEKLHAAIDAFLKAQDEEADKLLATSVLQVKLATEAFRSATMQEELDTGTLPQEDLIESRTNQFKTDVLVLQRLVINRAAQGELANRRLNAAQKFYLDAANMHRRVLALKNSCSSESSSTENALKQQQIIEMIEKAKTLVRSAKIDLEFARNLLLTKDKPPYEELIRRIAQDSEQ